MKEKFYKTMCNIVDSFPIEKANYLKRIDDIRALSISYYKSFIIGLNYLEIEYGKVDSEILFKNSMKDFKIHCQSVLKDL